MPISEIIDAQMPSLTEWLEKIGYARVAQFREEDNSKRDRLEILYQETGLPYDRPERLTARDIADRTPLFLDVVKRKGEQLCALRLVPIKPGLPKLRQRGLTLNEYLNGWFKEQPINPDDYKVEVVPHAGHDLFSAIFTVDDDNIWGEIVPGAHWQLTQGLYDSAAPINFVYHCQKNEWQFGPSQPPAEQQIKKAVEFLKIPAAKQPALKQKLNARFAPAGFLKGYFEFVVWPNKEIIFIDYNRLIPDMLGSARPNAAPAGKLTGLTASPGKARGRVKIVSDPRSTDFAPGEILVCQMTMVDYVPLMQKSAGIITEQGNLLSHAAIVARELKKPCLVGVKDVTALLKNGDMVELNANGGTIVISPSVPQTGSRSRGTKRGRGE